MYYVGSTSKFADMISIGAVLKDMQVSYEGSQNKFFAIKFIKEDGSIREVRQASVFWKQGDSSGVKKQDGFKYSLKEYSSIRIFDHSDGTYKTVKIPHIIEYNNIRVWH